MSKTLGMIMKHNVKVMAALVAVVMAGALPVRAGEYDAVSPGLMLDAAYSTANGTVPFQNNSGNIQGANTTWLAGIGIVACVRPAEFITAKLSNFNLMPGLAIRYGTTNDSNNANNLTFYASDGSQTSIQNAASSRQTTTTELVMDCPIRWYPSASSVRGGFWVEAGPGWDHCNKNVSLNVAGYVQSVPSSISESSTISSTVLIMTYGLGWTTTYINSQATFGLIYQAATKSNTGVSNQFRASLQWVF